MKRLFSSLMIFGCTGFFPLLGMDKLVPISASPKQKTQKMITDFPGLEKSLAEENILRISPKSPGVKKKLQKTVASSRIFIEHLINLKNPGNPEISDLLQSHLLFNNFIKNQLLLPNYTKEQHQKDDILLAGMYNALHSIFQTNPFSQDLTRSTLCINSFQSSSNALVELQKQKSDLEKQKKQIDTQLLSIDNQLKFESLKQEFARIELQKQTDAKVEQAQAEQDELDGINKEIEQLMKQQEEKSKQVLITKNRGAQMNDLLKWQGIGTENIIIDDSAVI